ncbi:hypothetical protein [Palleronia caenipelagi]|uniref:AAA+ family ATPase n=1 Tax=Palleronia caenipelagi TaxID=2489174 RepID=A0A547PRA4_9RHOB|nr:hypothetical protein [Palleronia caenipelagi]TRD16676.1 hypothetical protein FEV53_13820 [Palleronia caenipelagi]
MVRFCLCVAVICIPFLAPAQEAEQDLEDGAGMISEGTRLLLRGLLERAEPELQRLLGMLEEWDGAEFPLSDLHLYHAPEVLPNGDIILRRRNEPPSADPIDPPRVLHSEGVVDL